MSQRAKLFKSGGSQAVRLPREYRFEGQQEVVISREGEKVKLEPVRRRWSREFPGPRRQRAGLPLSRGAAARRAGAGPRMR